MSDKDFERYVDEYYNLKDKNNKSNESIIDSNKQQLFSMLDKLNIDEDKIITDDLDFMDIVLKGEKIREKRKVKIENLMFLLLAVSLIILFTSICVVIDSSIFIYVQMAIITLLPFSLIPLSYIKILRGEH